MSGFGAVFRAEVRDLSRHPLVWIGLVATAAGAWVRGSYPPYTDNGYVVYEAALQVAAQAASFFLLGIAATVVAGERTRGSIRWILPRPMARSGYVLGKAAALTVLAITFLALSIGVSWFVAKDYGFGDVVAEAAERIGDDEDDEGFVYIEDEVVAPEFTAATMRRRTVLATLLVLPALLTATGIGLLVSSLLGSAAGAVIVSIGVAIPLYWLPEVVGLAPETARLLPVRAASDFLDQINEFGRHLATADWPAYNGAAITGAIIAVLGLPALSALAFSRLDITD